MNWTDYFLNLAENVKLKSKDEATKIGAIIVGKDNEVLSVGYNSFPRGANDDVPERQKRPEKYYWFEHAERNAIYNAAKNGIRLEGSTIYLSSTIACMPCSRAIINSGIKRMFCKPDNQSVTNNPGNKWEEEGKRAKILLDECGIDVIYYDI